MIELQEMIFKSKYRKQLRGNTRLFLVSHPNFLTYTTDKRREQIDTRIIEFCGLMTSTGVTSKSAPRGEQIKYRKLLYESVWSNVRRIC